MSDYTDFLIDGPEPRRYIRRRRFQPPPVKLTLAESLRRCADELEKVWSSIGQVNANKFVLEARETLKREAS